jgi:hypothetical protein
MSDFQAIDIEGFFTRDLKPCGYIWSFNFKETYAKSPENHSSPKEGRPSPTLDDLVVDNQISPQVDGSTSSKGKGYTTEEDALIVNLKEIEKLSWPSIAAYFPKRTQMALQIRYFTKLKKKQHKNRLKDIIKLKTGQAKVAGEEFRSSRSSSRQYSLRRLRYCPDRLSEYQSHDSVLPHQSDAHVRARTRSVRNGDTNPLARMWQSPI